MMNFAPRSLSRLRPALVGGLGVLLLLAGCASPQARIDKNPDIFKALPAEQQALIKEGKVGIGFEEPAVKLALGEPDRITQRTDAKGKSTVWRYTQYEDEYGAPLYTGFYHRGFGYPYGNFGYPYGGFYRPSGAFFPYFAGAAGRRERDHIRVVFADGKVTAIEEELKK